MASPWDDIRGQTDRIEQFRRAAARGRIAQAYLFVGPGGVGKRLFARKLAQCLFCRETTVEQLDACGQCPSCIRLKAGTHPDLIEVGLPEGKRQLIVEQFVGDRESRGREGLCHELILSPTEANRKVAIIDSADRMGDEAANAFLKTLEEPPSGSVLFLIAQSVEGILPTILSRCQTVHFPPLPEEIVADLLVNAGTVDDRTEALAIGALCEGSLDTAATLLQPGLRQLKGDLDRELGRLPIDGPRVSQLVIERLDEAGDTAAQREAMSWIIRFAIDYFRRAMRLSTGAEAVDAKSSAAWVDRCRQLQIDPLDLFGDCIERLAEADRSVSRNVSLPLCVETLFADLARESKRLAG